MNENSGNNLVPRAFPSVHVKSLGTNFAGGNNYDYRYFLFGLKMTIIVILRSLTYTPNPFPNPYPSPNPNANPTR